MESKRTLQRKKRKHFEILDGELKQLMTWNVRGQNERNTDKFILYLEIVQQVVIILSIIVLAVIAQTIRCALSSHLSISSNQSATLPHASITTSVTHQQLLHSGLRETEFFKETSSAARV